MGGGSPLGAGTGGSARLSRRTAYRCAGSAAASSELATPDYKQIAYARRLVLSNAGWTRFNVPKPAEYSSKEAFAQYVKGKNPEAVFVLLTHDHGDHAGDHFDALKALVGCRRTGHDHGQSDLMRAPTGLVPDFQKAGLTPAKIVSNGGAGMNFGGTSKHGAMTARLVPAVHSTLHCLPGRRIHARHRRRARRISGDTDLFGEMKTLGERTSRISASSASATARSS